MARTIARVAGAAFVPLDAKLAQAVREVLGYVKVKNPVGPDGTIPDELLTATQAIAAYRFLAQIPSDKLATSPREKAYENALTQLRDVAKGTFTITAPDTYAPRQSAPTLETVQDGAGGNSREDLRGL